MNAKYRIVILGLLLQVMATYSSTSMADIHVVGGTVPFVLHGEHPGPHNIIFNTTIVEAAPSNLERTMLPYARAIRDFQAREFDCLYATTNNPFYFAPSLIENQILLISRPVNTIKLHVYSRDGENVIHALEDMRGKTIVGTRNQLRPVKEQLGTEGARFITVFDAPKAFELLNIKRADIAAVYNMDAHLTVPGQIAKYSAQNKPQTTRYLYDARFAPAEWGEILACWNRPETKLFIENFDKQVTQLEATGDLSSIFDAFK